MANAIPVGKSRFLFFLDKVKVILNKADGADNPALVIYTENIRTSFFMLEALSRLYKHIHNHKKFSKLNDLFKDIEDKLGAIDFYDAFHKEFSNDKKIPVAITQYLKKCKEEKIRDLNNELKSKKWVNSTKRIKKIIEKLDEAEWLDEKKDAEAIQEVYREEINKMIIEYKLEHHEFKDVETDVHEFRRKLRWLSIYPQSLQGLIQLKENKTHEDYFTKYLTPEILNSPFNKMPNGSALQNHIMLKSNCFYALSWMIDQLGKLKDSGLKISAIEESLLAVYKTAGSTEPLAYAICNEDQLPIPDILNKAQQLANTFFGENILENIFN